MSEELDDEVTSINSIYDVKTLTKVANESNIYALTLPSQPEISLRIEFPLDYPEVPPSILGTETVGDDIPKGKGAYVVELVREVLAELYTPGAACVYDLVEETASRLQQLGLNQSSKAQEQRATQTDGQQRESEIEAHPPSNASQAVEDLGEEPHWTQSEVFTEKKSVFVARSAPVTSIDQAKKYLTHLLSMDKKVAKATHNITAWRIQGENGVQYQDCDDDGETAAGGRVLHLLELMGVWNAMVVVTRWYGGVQLGPDRFRIINKAAREALVNGGFAQDPGKDTKKKGRK